jgi:phthiocerol/phenolphthiocerol synthesis type-I polyketide synthase E
MSQDAHDPAAPEGFAVVGMAGRFPGAADLDEFWRNLRDGVESITFWSREELAAAGVDPALLADPRYVPAAGALAGADRFDAAFFGFSPREAEILDPQHRLFLEHAWTALEHAGYDSESYRGSIGIFGGMGMSSYLLNNLLSHPDVLAAAGPLQVRILNDKDFLVSLAAFKLGLTGPSLNVQSACSTSLVATCLACQSLMSYQCDMALAGGVSVSVPQTAGYLPLDSVTSPDGHCRAFDAIARGTVSGSGVGVVVLKRLADALADGDTVYAVVRGFATNNDGSLKMGYTAPSVDGQVEVIAMAQAVAGVRGDAITYVEAHGTGTPLGDPIEVEALTEVFRAATGRTGFCAIGSVKTNIGHLDAAAGVASLLKTVLALEHRTIPPSLHFERPNPQIDFAATPFFVQTAAAPWTTDGAPRLAGVSSFAIGGVNAHLVLEEAPPAAPSDPAAGWHLLLLSARTGTALERAAGNLLRHLRERPAMSAEEFADLAWTLQVGRRTFRHRLAVVCRGREDAIACLEGAEPRRLLRNVGAGDGREARVAFLFPGLGNHHAGMARGLYRAYPHFRATFDECAEILRPELGADLRELLYPAAPAADEGEAATGGLDLRALVGRGGAAGEDEAGRRLARTELAQPAVFVVEYALARLLMSCGVEPEAMLGFSVGEYVAACLAGVMTLADALRLVARRARAVGALPAGAMLAVPAGEAAARELAGEHLAVAAVIGPELTVLAGAAAAVDAAEARLAAQGLAGRRLQTGHAFHSRLMEPAAARLPELLSGVELRAPEIPFLSNVTGSWITAAQAASPAYWAEHLTATVRFGDGLGELWQEPRRVLVEVGPGATLASWALQHPAAPAGAPAVPTLRHALDRQDDQAFLLGALARLWLAGARVDWAALEPGRRRRVPLPTYPFESERFWLEPRAAGKAADAAPPAPPEAAPARRADPADGFYLPGWKQAPPPAPAPHELPAGRRRWLIFADRGGLGARLGAALTDRGGEIAALVRAGERFARDPRGGFTLAPQDAAGYDRLLDELAREDRGFDAVLHLWNVEPPDGGDEAEAERGFFSLQGFARAVARHVRQPLEVLVVTAPIHRVTGGEAIAPGRATLLGPALSLGQEIPRARCRVIDVAPLASGEAGEDFVGQLLDELLDDSSERVVAWRHGLRWVRGFEPVRLERPAAGEARLAMGSVWLITGGLGGVGLALAKALAGSLRARLVLVGRSPLPAADPGLDAETAERIDRLQALRDSGAEVLVLTADVTDEASMRRAVAAARARFGRIDAVLHAAGVPPGGLMEARSREDAAAVLAPKVRGTLVLERVLADDPPELLLLCSSLSALSGAFGLADHCAANAFLDAFAQSRAGRRRPFTLAVGWDTWLEVGQAARAAQRFAGGAAAAEPAGHPLLAWRRIESAEREVWTGDASTALWWVLDEHRLQGDGLLPGTAYLELIRAAAAPGAGGAPVAIRRLVFLAPLRVREGERRPLRVVLEGNGGSGGNGGERLARVARVESRSAAGGDWVRHAEAAVGTSSSAPGHFDLAALLATASPREVTTAETGPVSFGPRWQGLLRELRLGPGEGLALHELDERFAGDLAGLPLHPALLDAATGVVQSLGTGAYLPLAYEEVVVHAPLPRRLWSRFRLQETGAGETLAGDLSLFDEDGRECVAIRGFTLRRLDPGALPASLAPAASSLATSATTGAPAVGGLAAVYGDGLRPDEGGEALLRLLGPGVRSPQLLATPRDLDALLRLGEAFTPERLLGALAELRDRSRVRPRPDLPVPCAPPRNPVEQRLVEVLADILRVEPVGIHDSFFDLGGDSILATRLVGALGESFDVQLSLRTVFEAPSAAELALAVVRAQAAEVDGAALAATLDEIRGLSPAELQALLAEEARLQQEEAAP